MLASLGLALLALQAAAAPSVFLEDHTSPELRERIKAGATIILVPIGGTEQNGAHMALGKHNARAKKLAGRIATTLGNAVVAPVIAYVPEGRIDPPTGHMMFAGTITTPVDAFEKVLESAALGFRAHGFHDVVFLGDSGDYQKNLKAVAARMNRGGAAGFRVHALEAYYRAAAIREHAGADDTSLTLALEPSLVRAEGRPAGTSAEAGQRIAELVVTRTVDAIRAAVRR